MHVLAMPFKFVWGLTAFVLNTVGRFAAVLIGVVLTLTVIGAVVGVPMALLGFALTLRGLF